MEQWVRKAEALCFRAVMVTVDAQVRLQAIEHDREGWWPNSHWPLATAPGPSHATAHPHLCKRVLQGVARRLQGGANLCGA